MTISAQVTFIDLSAYSELEGFLYGGPYATTYFVGTVQKGNWFSLVPISLRTTSTPDFDVKSSAVLNRSADYVLQVWFKFTLPIVQLSDDPTIFDNATVRWTRKLGHNIFTKITLTHNELLSQEFTNNWLDFNYNFNVPSSKRIGYRNMIGDVANNYVAVAQGAPLGTGGEINVPLPLWFSVDSGRALPIAALPFNETKINYEFRSWKNLLVVYPGDAGGGGTRIATVNDVHVVGSPSTKPSFGNPETFALYAMVHNEERARMGEKPRDILMHQIQQVQATPFKDVSTVVTQNFDIRFSNSVVALYFAAENTSIANQKTSSGGELSNYTTQPNYDGDQPFENVQLLYENNLRVDMTSSYYTLIAPYYHSRSVPDETGYHLWSYALDTECLNPCGSTNFTKITSVAISYTFSDSSVLAANVAAPLDNQGNPITWTDSLGATVPMPQTWKHVFIARSHNIGRIGNGGFGFPTL